MLPLSLYCFILIELMAVAYFDIKTQKIPNLWSIINIIVSVGFLIVWHDLYAFSLKMFFFPIVFLIVGFILFVLGIMGGGDAKFLFSLFLIVPEKYHEEFFVDIAYTTVVIGSSLLTRNLIMNKKLLVTFFRYGDTHLLKTILDKKFPFAPIILLGWLWLGWELYFERFL